MIAANKSVTQSHRTRIRRRRITAARFDKMHGMSGYRRILRLLLMLLCLLPAATQAETARITVYVTVDWEGLSLDDENLQSIREFRMRHPHIPMLHLLNPAYYLRPGADSKAVTAKIRSTLLPVDTVGMHLHGWKALLQACRLPYRKAPSFADKDESCSDGDCGYTVSLEYAYSEAELTALLACGSELLQQQGFERPVHFRAGGWQLGPRLAAALRQAGFRWDSSRIAADLLLPKWREAGSMIDMLRELHGDASILDQPYELLPGLMEFPDNAALMDYTSTERLLDIFRQLLEAKKPVMVTGFHQETAFVYLDDFEEAIRGMERIAAERGVLLTWGRYD